MAINQLAADQRDEFFLEHGDYVRQDGTFIFEDGATTEENPMSLLCPPPDDEYQQAQLVCRFHQIQAEIATDNFDAFKAWLSGNGKRQDEWAKLYTDEDRLDHLRQLQNKARLLRSRYARHRRELERMTPDWLKEAQDVDIEQQTRQAEFAQTVDDIKL